VANSAEGVGQLLANSALMKGERELLRKRDDPPAEKTASSAARVTAEPIVNDSKVISAVLLTLLDERLQADAALTSNLRPATSGNNEADASKRVAAKYAADGLIPGDDLIAPQQPVQPELARVGNVPPIASPDLQTFMQRFVAIVAGRPANTSVGEVGGGRKSLDNAPVSFGAASVLRIAGFTTGIIWLIILVVAWAAH
jgi:hypothetical protein